VEGPNTLIEEKPVKRSKPYVQSSRNGPLIRVVSFIGQPVSSVSILLVRHTRLLESKESFYSNI